MKPSIIFSTHLSGGPRYGPQKVVSKTGALWREKIPNTPK